MSGNKGGGFGVPAERSSAGQRVADDDAETPELIPLGVLKRSRERREPLVWVGNVECTGGPLPGTPIVVNFIGTLTPAIQA